MKPDPITSAPTDAAAREAIKRGDPDARSTLCRAPIFPPTVRCAMVWS